MRNTIPDVVQQIQGGSIKAYAVSTATRDPTLPNVPTAKEAGLSDFAFSAWYGLFAPKEASPRSRKSSKYGLGIAWPPRGRISAVTLAHQRPFRNPFDPIQPDHALEPCRRAFAAGAHHLQVVVADAPEAKVGLAWV
jgi:Tripartite tricarboxylate transporter family receptor